MPRIKAKKNVYVTKDLYIWLSGKMKSQRMTQKDLARELGTSQQNLSYKFNNTSLTTSELVQTLHILGVTQEEIGKLLIY